MPKQKTTGRDGGVRWRTVTLADGRTVRVAVVRRAGPRGRGTGAGQPAEGQEG
jgi:hypothetical protein